MRSIRLVAAASSLSWASERKGDRGRRRSARAAAPSTSSLDTPFSLQPPSPHPTPTPVSLLRPPAMFSLAQRRTAAALPARSFVTVSQLTPKVKVAAVDNGSQTASLTLVLKGGSRYEPSAGVANVVKNFAFKVRPTASKTGPDASPTDGRSFSRSPIRSLSSHPIRVPLLQTTHLRPSPSRPCFSPLVEQVPLRPRQCPHRRAPGCRPLVDAHPGAPPPDRSVPPRRRVRVSCSLPRRSG